MGSSAMLGPSTCKCSPRCSQHVATTAPPAPRERDKHKPTGATHTRFVYYLQHMACSHSCNACTGLNCRGLPSQCSDGCAAALLPLVNECGTELSALTMLRDTDAELEHLANACRAPSGGSTATVPASGCDVGTINVQMISHVQPACCDDGGACSECVRDAQLSHSPFVEVRDLTMRRRNSTAAGSLRSAARLALRCSCPSSKNAARQSPL